MNERKLAEAVSVVEEKASAINCNQDQTAVWFFNFLINYLDKIFINISKFFTFHQEFLLAYAVLICFVSTDGGS